MDADAAVVSETQETCPGCGERVVRRSVTSGGATTTSTVHVVPGDDPDTRCRHDAGTYPGAQPLEPYPGDTQGPVRPARMP